MAKKSKIAKAQKQMRLIARYAERRRELKAAGDDEGLRQLPRDANPNRLKNRDWIDGRPCVSLACHGLNFVNWHIRDRFLV
jgi:small subunit ribosomal protein S14